MRLVHSTPPLCVADFNPRIPYGMRHNSTVAVSTVGVFQSTHPVWDATSLSMDSSSKPRLFQSTHPVWDATSNNRRTISTISIFQSTHPVWDATLIHAVDQTHVIISIHASRMGCDGSGRATKQRMWLISIHASRMGCDSA